MPFITGTDLAHHNCFFPAFGNTHFLTELVDDTPIDSSEAFRDFCAKFSSDFPTQFAVSRDANLVALRSVSTGFRSLCVTYSRTSYLNFLFHSNLLGTITPKKGQTTGNKFLPVRSGEFTCPIYAWPKGNSLKVAATIVTRDGHLMLAKRAGPDQVLCSPDTWISTVSHQMRFSLRDPILHMKLGFRNLCLPYHNEGDVPCAFEAIEEGIIEEMGTGIFETCRHPKFLGIVERTNDYSHPTLAFLVETSLTASQMVKIWRKENPVGILEFEHLQPVIIRKPDKLLDHMIDPDNNWSAHGAGSVLLALSRQHQGAVKEAGLKLSY